MLRIIRPCTIDPLRLAELQAALDRSAAAVSTAREARAAAYDAAMVNPTYPRRQCEGPDEYGNWTTWEEVVIPPEDPYRAACTLTDAAAGAVLSAEKALSDYVEANKQITDYDPESPGLRSD